MIHDEKAEKLEQAGFYRRAAVRWLTVLDNCRDALSREWVTRRPLTDTFGDVRKAATELQKSMGIWQPDGDAFRKIKKHSSK
ncbi:PerC family transcriptional regulator [Salmonella enterica subsp. diarizonae]|uniref:PerC family transcriptional regulator n=1 Tax=Salmonella enterica TaxID=28901 RepID=UPI0008A9ABB2|nr:PerC family transcriptional regulator [Salmonella enterica]EAS9235694.1 PerC family transcriptional regulator [Salmonella enterica subsp. enterica]EBW7863439.1 PerC family transcriptional regulator [Salmonella enterica subsp. enterica serovar Newport]EEP9807769.1 PerC family transcriptional regulator [Salmonella enterica subsp. diarizonae]HCM1889196.1 PerC family transcriptional regulator [Salmonella enterica subsp. diarizonae serovar 57:c:z]EAA9288979.1 PerC family transcriptional regulato